MEDSQKKSTMNKHGEKTFPHGQDVKPKIKDPKATLNTTCAAPDEENPNGTFHAADGIRNFEDLDTEEKEWEKIHLLRAIHPHW